MFQQCLWELLQELDLRATRPQASVVQNLAGPCWRLVRPEANRSKDAVPVCSEHGGDFLPAHPPGPSCKKQTIRMRLLILPAGPRDSFDHNVALRAVHSPQRIHQEDRDRPQWHIFKSSDIMSIVTRSLPATARTDGFQIPPSLNFKRDRDGRRVVAPSGFAAGKELVFLDGTENSLELHSGVPVSQASVVR